MSRDIPSNQCCTRCGGTLRVQLMGTLVCTSCGSSHAPASPEKAKDEKDFDVWWDRVNRESFRAAYGPSEPYREAWGAGHRGYALMGWMARSEHHETSEDSTDAVRYRFLRDRLVAQGPITYYHMPRALMFLRDETQGTFDTAVDARMKGVEHEPPETEPCGCVSESQCVAKDGPPPTWIVCRRAQKTSCFVSQDRFENDNGSDQ